MGLFVAVNMFTASAWLELHLLATSICLTKSRGESSGDVDWEAVVVLQRRCLVHVLSCRASNALVGSVGPHTPSASSFLSILPFCPFPRCWHPTHCGANLPGFPPCPLHGRAAGMLCWGSQRWISRCFPQIPLAVLVSLSHMIQLMESRTAWVREILGLFFLVLLGG